MSLTVFGRAEGGSVEDVDWFDQARFGLFVHYGLYALLGRGEWVMHREHIAHAEYRRLMDGFRAGAWDPAAQARLARAAGMRYAVLTTRHHDGFCLWDTATTDFNAPASAARRDLVREWVEAMRAEGLRVGLYYSLADWSRPAYWSGPQADPDGWAAFRETVHAQLRELLTGYGPVDVLWFDGFWPWPGSAWGAAGLHGLARALQPGILINDRAGIPGDFTTPEQGVSVLPPPGRWEACMTLNGSWGWHAGDHDWKSPAQLIRTLVQCATGGGNFLLNAGPMPDGTIPPETVERLEAVSGWMSVNGRAIYGSVRSRFLGTAYGPVTCGPESVFLHLYQWPNDGTVTLAHLENRALSARLLATGQALPFEQTGDVVRAGGLPGAMPDPADTVVELVVEGRPRVTAGGYILWRGPATY